MNTSCNIDITHVISDHVISILHEQNHNIDSTYVMSILHDRDTHVMSNWYANWRQFGANKSDASSECPNIRVPMFCIQTVKKRDLAAPQPNLSGCAERKMVIWYV